MHACRSTLEDPTVYFAVFASLFAFITPAYEAPDESSHLQYINFVGLNHELPNQFIPEKRVEGEGLQLPLYYVCGAVLESAITHDATVDLRPQINPLHIWAGGTTGDVPLHRHLTNAIFPTISDLQAFYALRIMSVLFAVANVLCVVHIGRLFIREPGWDLLPAALVASIPQFQFVAGTINSDNLANAFTSMTLLFALMLVDNPTPRRTFVLLGVSIGLGLLTKKTVLFTIPGIALILAYVLWRNREARREILVNAALALAVAFSISIWVIGRSYLIYGEFFGIGMERKVVPQLIDEKSILAPYFWGPFVPEVFRSFIGTFGWMNLGLADPVYKFYLGLLAAAGVGLGLHMVRTRFSDVKIGFAALFFLACFAALVVFNLTFTQYQGRYLFPAVSMIAVLVAVGVKTLVERIPVRHGPEVAITGVLLTLVIINISSLLRAHGFYYRIEQFTW